MKTYILTAVLLSVLSFAGQVNIDAQEPPIRYGKLDRSELERTVYPAYPNAPAVILDDYGKTFFLFPDVKEVNDFGNQSAGFRTVYYHYTRIKMLDTTASHWADVVIPVYHTELAREEVLKLHATTYNLKNGKVIKTKLTDDLISTEAADKNRDKIKFSMPGVRNGSVIEFEYTLTSEFLYNLPSWQFQYSIPVIRSEYEVVIPEYYRYNQILQGYIPVKTSSETRMRKIMLTYQEKPQGLTNRVATHTRDIDYYETSYRYLAENVEAFPVEAYLTMADNYLTEIEFELSSTKFPGQAEELSANNWATVCKALLIDEDFGLRLTGNSFLIDEAAKLKSLYANPVQRMNGAFAFVQQKLQWNGKYGKYSSAPLENIYHQGTGNVADVNLLLVSLLNKSGISASPVILSTRDNGFIDPSRVSLSRINYVIACAVIEGKRYLMDATDLCSAINLLPPRCLNGQGIIVDELMCGWIDLSFKEPSTTLKKLELVPGQIGAFSGRMVNTLTNYAAYHLRKEVKSFPDESGYQKKIMEKNPGLTLTGWKCTNLDSLNLPVSEEYDCVITGLCEIDGESILFQPLLNETLEDNPFKLPERKYPVEFCYPFSEQFSMQIRIPEGYRIESIPSPLHINLPGNAADYAFSIDIKEGQILCMSNLQVSKLFFLPAEYEQLRQFYDAIISKQAEKVKLKKL